jgi:hypothetical protein
MFGRCRGQRLRRRLGLREQLDHGWNGDNYP